MIKIQKIIWATDGSKEARYALGYTELLARAFNSHIIGVHVIPVFDEEVFEPFANPRLKAELSKWVADNEKKWAKTFEDTENKLKEKGLNFKWRILKGEPRNEVVNLAQSEKADLILLGKRGLGSIDIALLGSLTIKILRDSPIPILAVKSENKKMPRIERILVPIDISEKINSTVNYALDFAKVFGASISFLYVFETGTYLHYKFPPNIIREFLEAYSKKLKKMTGNLTKEDDELKIKRKVMEAQNPWSGIINFVKEEKIDLIIMNTHGRKGIKRLILGSVAEKVIQKASCPVLAIKPGRG